ncbi:regulatory protein, tetR family [Mycolicibacterium rutilum]|uniref:Regulatory protein, tetR family n=1 Tax=Mycolicibacterium rutilum TaxID=370526 RepID=A0A1H6KY88_MYCRU|nr:TetR/AcrR family transcriptional regulator [Mycolicibacterium rutilum]SEH77951.1 regulatory protein, tetR family [Mycolicibacterium rutilum]
MSEAVKRTYSSQLRSAQARETRRAIVAAASRLFVESGYGATTTEAIAEAAGVSRKTVFTAAGGKADILRLAIEWAVAGDDEPTALVDRDVVRRLLAEADPVALLRGWAAVIADIDARTARLLTALEAAAASDADARELADRFERQRLAGARRVVDRLSALGALGLSRRDAVDLAWLSTDPVLYHRLVHTRGWSARRFEKWLAETLCRQLLGG